MALAALMAAEAFAPFMFGGATLGAAGGFAGEMLGDLRVGEKLKKLFPISYYKVGCWRESLSRELDKLHKDCRELISKEIEQIHDNYL